MGKRGSIPFRGCWASFYFIIMAGTDFNEADLVRIEKLRQEIDRLNERLQEMDRTADPGGFERLLKKIAGLERQAVQAGIEAGIEAGRLGAVLAQSAQESVSATADFDRLGETVLKALGGTAFAAFAKSLVAVRGEFQQLELSFKGVLGSKQKADALMAQVVDVVARTPFDVQQIADGAKQLLSYGVGAEDVSDTLLRLGSVSSGLSVPLDGLVDLYGGIAEQGRLFTADLAQFSSLGIPLAEELAKQFGATEDQVGMLVASGKAGFPEVQQAIGALTGEGSRFYSLMDEQNRTISGQVSNLGDAFGGMLNEIGQAGEGVLSGALGGAMFLVENYQKVGETLLALVGTYGAARAATIAYHALTVSYGVYDVATKELQLAATLKNIGATKAMAVQQAVLNKVMLSNPYVFAAAALAALAFGVYQLATAESEAEKSQRKLQEAVKESEKAALSEQRELARLKGELAATTKGTEEYDRVKNKIVTNYGKYDKNLKDEIEQVGFLDTTYRKLTESIRQSFGARQYEKFRQEQKDSLDETMSENLDEMYQKLTAKWGDEQGSKYYAEIRNALLAGEAVPRHLNNVVYSLYGFWGIMLSKYIRNIRQAQKATEEADRQARVKFGVGKDDGPDGSEAAAVRNKTFWEKQKTDALIALNAIDSKQRALLDAGKSEGVGAGVAGEYRKQAGLLEEAEKELKSYAPKAKGAGEESGDIGLKGRQALHDAILKNQLELEQARLSIIQDGRAKRLKESEDEHKKREEAILKEREALLKKYKDVDKHAGLSDEDEMVFDKRLQLNDGAKISRDKGVEKEYDQELATRAKVLTDVLLTEEERRTAAIRERYAKEREWARQSIKDPVKQSDYLNKVGRAQQHDETFDLLEKYKTHAQKRLAVEEKYERDIKAMRKAGAGAESVALAEKEKQGALDQLDAVIVAKDDQFQRMLGNITRMSLRKLSEALASAKAALDESGPAGDDKKAAADRAKIKAMEAQIAVLRKQGDRKDVSNADKWKDTLGVMEKTRTTVDGMINSFDGLNAATKAALSAASNIAGGVISMIGSIQKLSIVGTEAVKGAERASVVLAIISAAFQVTMALFNLFSKDKKSEQKIQELQKEVESLSKTYGRLGKAIENTYSDEVYGLMDSQQENLRKQQDLLQQQIAEEEGKKKTDQGKIDQWKEQIVDIDQQLADNERKQIEMLAGTGVKNAIDNFADALVEAYAKGEDGAKALGDTTKKMMANAVKESLKKKFLGDAIAEAVAYLGNSMKDGVLSKSEQRRFDDMVQQAGRGFTDAMDKVGYLFEDEGPKEIEDGVTGQLQAAMTEGTANQVLGAINMMNIRTSDILLSDAEHREISRAGFFDVCGILRDAFEVQKRIETNTASTVSGLREGFDRLDVRLGSIEANTKGYNGRG